MVGLLNYLASGWPPGWIVRRDQRKLVMERVVAAGGWPALQQASDALVESNLDSGFRWLRVLGSNQPPLPAALAALRPQEVWFYSPSLMRGTIFGTDFLVVHVKIFGVHSTGSYAYPYFGHPTHFICCRRRCRRHGATEPSHAGVLAGVGT